MNIATSKTGANSFSGITSIVGVVSGIASALQAITTSGTDAHQAIFGGGGIILALGSLVAKLFHDQGIHVASVYAAGHEVAAQLPQLKADLQTAVGFVEQDLPPLHGILAGLGTRVAAIENKAILTESDVDGIIRKVLGSLITHPAVTMTGAVPSVIPDAPA